MGRKKKSVDSETTERAKEALASVKEWKLTRRLIGVISYSTHSSKQVAAMLGVSAPNVIHWAAKFKKHGIDGLRDQPKGHRKPILDGQAAEAVRGWIVGAVDAKGRAAHWTLEKLCLAVRGEFGIEIKKSAMANKLKSMKLSVRRPRPFHHKTDEKLKDDFKKNERSRREPCQRRR